MAGDNLISISVKGPDRRRAVRDQGAATVGVADIDILENMVMEPPPLSSSELGVIRATVTG